MISILGFMKFTTLVVTKKSSGIVVAKRAQGTPKQSKFEATVVPLIATIGVKVPIVEMELQVKKLASMMESKNSTITADWPRYMHDVVDGKNNASAANHDEFVVAYIEGNNIAAVATRLLPSDRMKGRSDVVAYARKNN